MLLTSRIAAGAREHPDRIAVAGDDGEVTYAELDRRARELSGVLSRRGIGPGSLVAVHLRRCASAVVALAGVMGSGGAYTVVEDDGANPDEKRRRIAAARPSLVLTDGARCGSLAAAGLTTVDIAEAGDRAAPPPAPPSEDDIAYVMFTSGSTGVPKGVAVTHGNVEHYTESVLERLGVDRPLRYAHVSTLAADLGHTCLLLSLWTGGTLHVVGDEVRKDPAALARHLTERRIQFLKITPSHWAAAFHGAGVGYDGIALEYLVLGGEALPVAMAEEILRSGAARVVVNHYGPTETTVGVTANVIRGRDALPDPSAPSVPIGTPLGLTRALVRTDGGDFRAVDAEGELYIGGPSVAAGYVGDPAATAERFVTGVEGPARFYRTGDLVRIDERGVIAFRCRTDRQVKVGGHRVELTHVESALRSLDEIADAAAFHARVGGGDDDNDNDKDDRILAAAVVATAWPGEAELRERLAHVVPRQLIPQRVLRCERFPLNSNGKTDLPALGRKVEDRLARERSRAADDAGRFDDPLVAEVHETWRTHLRHGRFSPADDFFAVGGTSIDAIQVISELQANGHAVSANAFLRTPTIEALTELIRAAPRGAAAPEPPAERAGRAPLAPAQHAFLEAGLADADHYTQALVLEVRGSVDAAALEAAVADLVELHPLVRTAFRREDGAWSTEPTAGGEPFSRSAVRSSAEDVVAAAVATASHRLNRSIRIESGSLFRAHLIAVPGGKDQLLLVAHHLAVDAVSWRILIADLVRLYGARAAGRAAALPAPPSFWRWTEHLEAHRPRLRRGTGLWRAMLHGELPALRGDRDGTNLEREATSVWMAVHRDDLERLAEPLRDRLGVPLHMALLGAFAHAVALREGARRVLADVESHGRATFTDDLDVSRIVGWFTSTFPLAVTVDAADAVATMRRFHAALSAVPDLGLGYGVLRDAITAETGGAHTPAFAYNYLGAFDLPRGGALELAHSHHRPSPARGPANERGADLKLTARMLDGHLVADLSFSDGRHDADRMTALARTTLALLHGATGVRPEHSDHLLVERGSSSGLLTYAPRRLRFDEPAKRRAGRRFLLTGATGFVGAHVLREVLHRTGAHVTCLVRARSEPDARNRLRDTFEWYFPGEPLERHEGRWSALAGDVAAERFGLPTSEWSHLAGDVDAIYHFAADTRLFADAGALERTNVGAVRTAIALAAAGRATALHHMSTLAVSGVNPSPGTLTFSETSLDVGQRFQNDYERTKHQAEKLLRAYAARGGRVFVYRSGNVAAHSRTGRFQRNAADNRVIQLLRAVAKVGRLPATVDGAIVLSPVDAVAAGIVELSVSPDVAPGTFHVESATATPVAALVDALVRAGAQFVASDEDDFAEVLRAWGDPSDPEIALGSFWAARPSRHVRYSAAATLRQLEALGVRFPPPDDAWLDRFVDGLSVGGALGRLGPGEGHGRVAV